MKVILCSVVTGSAVEVDESPTTSVVIGRQLNGQFRETPLSSNFSAGEDHPR
jgi:hypothetical protein